MFPSNVPSANPILYGNSSNQLTMLLIHLGTVPVKKLPIAVQASEIAVLTPSHIARSLPGSPSNHETMLSTASAVQVFTVSKTHSIKKLRTVIHVKILENLDKDM